MNLFHLLYTLTQHKMFVCMCVYLFIVFFFQVRRADPHILTALTWRKNFVANTDYDGPSRYKEWWKQILAPVLDRIWELHLHSWVYDFLGVSVFLSHTAHLSRYWLHQFSPFSYPCIQITVNSHYCGHSRNNGGLSQSNTYKNFLTGISLLSVLVGCP